jgi:predicted transcriptional regulator
MATMTIRLPDELKRQMDQADINWSEVFRDAAEARLLRMRRQAVAKRMDELREEVFRRSGGKLSDSTKEIRKWRDSR